MIRRWILPLLALLLTTALRADGPRDNHPDKVRPVPPPGIAVPEADRTELLKRVAELGKEIEALRKDLAKKPALLELLPDVQIFHNAVRYALTYNEFYNKVEFLFARDLLHEGQARAGQLRAGWAPWTKATGLVVRGYRSKIDGSVQPYGLVVPATYSPNLPFDYRLDVWCHGRGETLTELSFLNGRMKSPGQFTPRDAFVLHPYGRYCNANKFAGEIDVLEALAHAQKHYRIDEGRIVMRGFSMGGAACWQFAVHYPGRWVAAAPGAGFSETADFLKVFQKEDLQPTEWERKLWHLYDCTDYALNLWNLPVVAYSGEKDSQKQAADMMAAAMRKQGMTLTHLIGPGMGHAYHPAVKKELNRRIDRLARLPLEYRPALQFTTWTLRYNRVHWLILDGLEQHWQRATVKAYISDTPDEDGLKPREPFAIITTANVSALTLDVPSGDFVVSTAGPLKVMLDGQELKAPPVLSDHSWTAHFRKIDGKWQVVKKVDDGTLRKRHGLQGPIDDAFMDSFLMVKPTGKALNERVGTWADAERKHAVEHWRKQFRGEARTKNDDAVTDADIAAHNLVLWGDPSSNKVLAKIADKLPIRWSTDGVIVGKKKYDAGHHVPVLIYPNPLNPKRYVVLNSGFTFREYDYLNNARQVPKLPDYAVIDVRTPPSSRTPGAIVTAGFFDEQWRLPK